MKQRNRKRIQALLLAICMMVLSVCPAGSAFGGFGRVRAEDDWPAGQNDISGEIADEKPSDDNPAPNSGEDTNPDGGDADTSGDGDASGDGDGDGGQRPSREPELPPITDEKGRNYSYYVEPEWADYISGEGMLTYSEYLARYGAPPEGTLFIGTYMIPASILNDVYYRAAVDSMATYNQQIMYYKSELAAGEWKDIYAASGLSDILPLSESLSDEDLKDYGVLVFIDEEGVARLASDGSEVNIFDLSDPYQLEQIPELVPLYKLYEAGYVSGDNEEDSERYASTILRTFFNTDRPYQEDPLYGPMTVEKFNLVDDVSEAASMEYRAFTLPALYGQKIYNYNANGDRLTIKNSDGNYVYSLLYDPAAESDTSFINFVFRRSPEYAYKAVYGKGFFETMTFWAMSDRPHEYVMCSSGNVNDSYMHTSYGNGDYGTAVPIISGIILLYDEYRIYITYGRGTDADWSKVSKEATASAYINPELYSSIMCFEEWIRSLCCVETDETRRLDQQLDNLYAMYLSMRRAGQNDAADVLMELMGKVDASRRAIVYGNLSGETNNDVLRGPVLEWLLNTLQDGKSSFGFDYHLMYARYITDYAGNHTDMLGEYKPPEQLVELIQDIMVQCQTSFNDYRAKALAEGSTVLSRREYELSQAVIAAADQSAVAGADVEAALRELNDIYNLENDAIVNRGNEIAVASTLTARAETQFADRIHQAAGDDYRRLASRLAAGEITQEQMDTTAPGVLLEQKADASSAAAQLQQLIRARALRMTESAGIDFINARIDWAEAQNGGILSGDPFGVYARQALEEHIRWLRDILEQIESGSLFGDDDILPTELDELEWDLLDALDDNDPDEVDRIDAAISALDNQISGTGGPDSGEGDVSGGNGDGTGPGVPEDVDKQREELAGRLIGELEEPDPEIVGPIIDALGELGYDKWDEIENLLPPNIDPEIKDRIDDAEKTSEDSPFRPGGDDTSGTPTGGEGSSSVDIPPRDGDGDTTGNGPGTGGDDTAGSYGPYVAAPTDATANALTAAAEQVLGRSFAGIEDEDKIAVIVACMRYGRSHGEPQVSAFARQVLADAVAEHHVMVYTAFTADPAHEYVSLSAIDRARKYTRFRCVRIGQKATMTEIGGGSASYIFTMGSTAVEKGSGATDTLTAAVVQQPDKYLRGSLMKKYPYIAENDSLKLLDISAEYIDYTAYACLVTPKIEERVLRLTEQIEAALK